MDFSTVFGPLLGNPQPAAAPAPAPQAGALANGGDALASAQPQPTPTPGAAPVGARAAQSKTAQVLATLRPQTGATAAGQSAAEGIGPGNYGRMTDPATVALASVNNAKTNGSRFGAFVSGLSAGEAGQQQAASAGLSNWINIQKMLTDQQHLGNQDAVAAQAETRAGQAQGFNEGVTNKELALKTDESQANVQAARLKTAQESRQPMGPGFFQYDVNNPGAPPVYTPYSSYFSQVAQGGGSAGASAQPAPGGGAAGASAAASPAPAGAAPGAAPGAPPPGQHPLQVKAKSTPFAEVTDPPPAPAAPVTTDMFSPNGAKFEADLAQKSLEAAQKDAADASTSQTKLAQMKTQAAQLTGSLQTGPGFLQRMGLARAANTAGEITGHGDFVPPDQVAAGETLNKLSTQLSAEMGKRDSGGRVAGYVFTQMKQAIPGSDNTPQGLQRMIGAIEADNQRSIDYAAFLHNYASSGYFPTTAQAQEAFNKLRPPQWYAARATISALPPDLKLPGQQVPLTQASQAAVEGLLANPQLAPAFDAGYGKGASKLVLGK